MIDQSLATRGFFPEVVRGCPGSSDIIRLIAYRTFSSGKIAEVKLYPLPDQKWLLYINGLGLGELTQNQVLKKIDELEST